MKRILFLFGAVFFFANSFAQENEFKPEAGDFSTEVNFKPFASSPLNIDLIRLRRFIDDENALRIGFMVNLDRMEDANNSLNDEDHELYQSIEVTFQPGFERHFEGTERLSPYVGIEAELTIKSSKAEIEEELITTNIEGAWSENGSNRGFTRLGMNLLFGADYYIAREVFIGVEFGWGYHLYKQSEISITHDEFDAANEIDGGSDMESRSFIRNGFRLGFNF